MIIISLSLSLSWATFPDVATLTNKLGRLRCHQLSLICHCAAAAASLSNTHLFAQQVWYSRDTEYHRVHCQSYVWLSTEAPNMGVELRRNLVSFQIRTVFTEGALSSGRIWSFWQFGWNSCFTYFTGVTFTEVSKICKYRAVFTRKSPFWGEYNPGSNSHRRWLGGWVI